MQYKDGKTPKIGDLVFGTSMKGKAVTGEVIDLDNSGLILVAYVSVVTESAVFNRSCFSYLTDQLLGIVDVAECDPLGFTLLHRANPPGCVSSPTPPEPTAEAPDGFGLGLGADPAR